MVGNFGIGEMAVVALVALLVFGPDRLPELARQAGKALARFRQETSKSVADLKRAAELEDLDQELREVRSELRQVSRGLTGATRTTTRRRPASSRPQTNGPTRGALEPPPPIDPDAT